MWLKHWQQRWWKDHCRYQVPCSAISRKCERICRENEILYDINWQLFYISKGNGNVAVFLDRSCSHFKVCPRCPGQPSKEIYDIQINSNGIFWSVGSFGILLLKWMDNVLLYLVTTVHNVMDVSKYLRRKPRVNENNKTTRWGLCLYSTNCGLLQPLDMRHRYGS